jgi:hypothetical protein
MYWTFLEVDSTEFTSCELLLIPVIQEWLLRVLRSYMILEQLIEVQLMGRGARW